MAHDESPHIDFFKCLRGPGHHPLVALLKLRPGNRRIRDIPEHTTIEQKVPDIGHVKLLLVVECSRTGTGTYPTISGDDRINLAFLKTHVLLGTLVANEREAH